MKNESNKLENEMVMVWTNVGTFVQRFIKVSRLNAKKSGLTLPRAWILQAISQENGMTETDLARYTGTTLPTITDILDELVKVNFITKNRSREDERKLVISISNTGREKLKKFQYLQQQFVEKIEKETGKEFMDKLSNVFQTLVKATNSYV